MPAQIPRSEILIHDKGKPTQDLRHVLGIWLCNVTEYSRRWAEHAKYKDCLYFYNETATVSTLAGAVWQAGSQALSDFSDEKEGDAGRYTGRADLWFSIRDVDYWCESKQRWPRLLYNKNTYRDEIEAGLSGVDESINELRSPKSSTERRLGLLFLTPTVSRNRFERISEIVETFVIDVCNYKEDIAFCAYTFPEQYPYYDKKRRYYPGVCLLGKYY